ncbi:predicted protein [Uncinocarpus reesii 1704]|uniref:Type 1 phosphatases regulator n=1 Tax=Uncinocarpus reesii (strain UAMH 1704) TaxID=336963 RepID=C4JTA8_UNCRE|nr:uncharacterized protein UREG_05697 [Uncinocarpus reesii 1704]EEP80855.1 predicted protein [Uncinocarpus reesii 1704]
MTRTRQPNPPVSSLTTTQVESSYTQQTRQGIPLTGTLRLRGDATTTQENPPEPRRIRWAEDVVDNEGQGKKSSKVGESSSESDSSDSDSSESDGDSEVDTGEARMANGRGPRRSSHGHDHRDVSQQTKRPRRKPKVNAYERVPNYSKGGEDVKKES